MNHKGTIELTTQRLTLRCFEREDAQNMYDNWERDPEVSKYLTWKPLKQVEDVEMMLQDWNAKYVDPQFYLWAIELNEMEQPIGSISAESINEPAESVEVSVCIGREFWNKGYAAEALNEVSRFFMEEVGAGRIWAGCDTDNRYAGKAMEAAGMDYEGTLRRAGHNNQGIFDMAVYAKVKSEALSGEEDSEEIQQTGASVTKVVGEDGRMRNVISDETMEYVGILAKLELSPEEADAARTDMEKMLDYIDQLDELDTTGIEPMSHVFAVDNVFREDVVENGDGREDTLANAPVQKDGGFKVPKTIGE